MPSPIALSLRSTLVNIMMHILDDKNRDSIKQKILARKQVREFDKEYMPWHRPVLSPELNNDPRVLFDQLSREHDGKENKTELIRQGFKDHANHISRSGSLLDVNEYQQMEDAKHRIQYYTETEVEKFRVIPCDGKLIALKVDGNNIDEQQLTFEYFDSANLSIKYKKMDGSNQSLKNRGIYVIDINGGIFVGPSLHPECLGQLSSLVLDTSGILHISYTAHMTARPFMAGQIGEVVRGEAGDLDGGSGHYKPSFRHWTRAFTFFKALKITHNNTKLQSYHPESQYFLDARYTEIDYEIYKYAVHNKLEIQMVTFDYLKANNPQLYNRYRLQVDINTQYRRWLQESNVIFTQPSNATLNLNDAMEKYSAYARIADIDSALTLVQQALSVVSAWNNYHRSAKKSSRRSEAVKALEIRLVDHVIHFKLHKLLMPFKNDHAIISDYLDYKITKEELCAGLQKIQSNISTFFAPGLLQQLLQSVGNILANSSLANSEKIRRLDGLLDANANDIPKSILKEGMERKP
jgi:hypothetical protein